LLDAVHRGHVSNGARDQDQRNVQAFFTQDIQSLRATPLPQVVVGQNYIRTIRSDPLPEIFGSLDHLTADLELTLPQLAQDQIPVSGVVLH
jgi:hypothetical protein